MANVRGKQAQEGFDHLGRYLITPPSGGKPEPYTRATTFAKTLDDGYGLRKWSERMVAIGLSRRADLLAGVAAARDDDATRIDSLVVDAREAAEASAGANVGTALHAFTERLDLGELQLEQVPEPWRADIAAYADAMRAAGFTMEVIEATVVIPELNVAGTLDRIVYRERERFILDVKTGQSLWHQTIAIQLALYAHATSIYDRATGTHQPMPDVNQHIGFVAHCPAGKGTCQLVALDLDAGWRGAMLAHNVRGFRRLAVIVEAPKDRRTWLVDAVKRLVKDYPEAAAALGQQWPIGVPPLKQEGHTPEQLGEIVAVLQRIERGLQSSIRGAGPRSGANHKRGEEHGSMTIDWNQFKGNFATWEQPGAKVQGAVTHVAIGSGFGKTYPELTVRTGDGEITVSVTQQNLQRQLADDPPALGDDILIEYLGEGEARPGMNAAKLFRYEVAHRTANLSATDLV